MSIFIVNARLLTLRGHDGPRRGAHLNDLGVIENGFMLIDGERIVEVGAGRPRPSDADDLEGDVIDAGGQVVMPAFVDCHTHACWFGDRFDEFEMALKGAAYLDILAAGGGIMSTVRAVRAADHEELVFSLLRRLAGMAALGTGTVEVKSGYGLDTGSELKMLRAIHAVAQLVPMSVVGTFLGAHAMDPQNPRYVEETIDETLPAVAQEFPEIVCDAYCEKGSWSVQDVVRLFEHAQEFGCPLRVHADQFNSLGMTQRAVEMGAVSVDHLEASNAEDLTCLAESSTFGVMLPCSSFHLGNGYAAGRDFIDAGGALAIATNYNPGSAPTPSMPFAIGLACRKLGLTVAEAITASTWNPACLLGLQDRVGSLEAGKRADIQLLDSPDERQLACELATPGPLLVMLGGEIVHSRAISREEEQAEDDE